MSTPFAGKLKELREARGMTQAALAARSGIPLGTIRDYEQGKRDPLFSNAQKLARALGVSLDVFPAEPGLPGPAADHPSEATSQPPPAPKKPGKAKAEEGPASGRGGAGPSGEKPAPKKGRKGKKGSTPPTTN